VVRAATAAGFDPERLRRARIQAGLSQLELAQRVGTDHTTIAKYESGDRAPFVERLAALATALGVTTAALAKPPAGTLAELRSAAGLSQQTAATQAGLVRTTYAAIERGEVTTLTPDISTRLATTFGVDPRTIARAHALARAAHLRRHGQH
jgi:transcriptional regulator with XRE-family HTH domain